MNWRIKYLTLLNDPLVPDPSMAFGPYDLTPTTDRCINCEKHKKILGTITLGNKTGPICVNCFKSYRE